MSLGVALDAVEVDRHDRDRAFSAGWPLGGAISARDEWMALSAIIRCATVEIMNCANSLAAFGFFASLIIATGEQTANAPSVGRSSSGSAVLAVVEAARIDAADADRALARLHGLEQLLVALHDHRVV